jgi:hypothetical protein
MKVTIEVDCTPSEARRFLGLPDFEPLQATVMKELERGTLEELQRLSPDNLLKNWLSAGSISAERMQDFVTGLFTPQSVKK